LHGFGSANNSTAQVSRNRVQSEVRDQGPIVRLASYGKQDLNFSLHGRNLKQNLPAARVAAGRASSRPTRLRSKRKDLICLAGSSKLGRAKGIYSHDDARRGTLDLFEFGLQVRSGSGGKCRQQGRQEPNLLLWLRYEETLFRAHIHGDPRARSCERHPGTDFLADTMIRFA
jgi:hypothetical protein